MHPAFSVIFFTTLSGAGYGLLIWAALAAMLRTSGATSVLACVLLGLVLATVGLLSSMAHLGKPGRAWRAFSQWRTSWLSREGVAAVATYLPAAGLAALMGIVVFASHGDDGIPPRFAGMVTGLSLWLIASALATVACTAMIYASLKPIPAWRHGLVVPVYLLFALLTGGLLCAALLESIGRGVPAAALAGIVLALLVAACKFVYWRAVDAPLPFTRADAVGLKGREVGVFERPHTQANYLTTEMGFVLARKHGRALRASALVLFAVLPMLLLLPVALFTHLDATPWLWAAALSAIAGAFVERWLFFAQARHLVTLYY
jgi:DMSO reductase anchor subunit